MKSYFLLIAGLLFWPIMVNAQKIQFKGQVTDSINAPLELANVVAERKQDGVIESFGVTNSDGEFFLELNPDSTYVIKSSFIGYKTFEKIIVPGQEVQPFKIVLPPSATQLSNVEIVEEYPIVITDDTITYKADAFTKGNERKLKDVLEAIPGFEVDEEGQIKVQGKSVEKVLVEGKEFFEGDTKLATKNIPANAVDKVQLLRNFNDVAPLGNVNNEDRLALNIKLKEGKKKIAFGDAEAGGGGSERYFSHANLFYYTPKLTLNLIADANNVGMPAFTPSDYFRFSGGFRSLANRSGSTININSDNMAFLGADARSAEEIESKLGAFNFNYVPNRKWSFSGFAIASSVKTDFSRQANRTYLTENGEINENQTSSTYQDMNSGLLKLSGRFTPNYQWHFNAETLLKTSRLQSSFSQLSKIEGNLNNQLNNSQNQQPYSVNQQVNAYYALNDKNIFSFENNLEISEQDPQLELRAQLPLFSGTLPDNTTLIDQQQNNYSFKQESLFNYYHVLNPTNHIAFSTGFTWLNQTLTTNLMANETADQAISNDVEFSLEDKFAGVEWKSKLGDFVINPRVSFHHYQSTNMQLDDNTTFEKWVTLPRLNVKYNLNASQSIVADYSKQVDFFNVDDLINEVIVSDYSLLASGNPELQNAVFHSLHLNYFNYDMFSFFNIYGGLSYQYREDDFSSSLTFDGINRVATPFNLSEANELASGKINFSKTFTKWKFSGNTSLSFSKRFNEVKNELALNESLASQFSGTFETTLWKKLFVKIGYRHVNNAYTGNNTEVTYITKNPFASLEFSFLKNLTFRSDYEYFDYQSDAGNTKTTYAFLNTTLTYQKEDSPWSFNLKGINLLNTNEIRNDNFSDNLIETSARNVQPVYWLVTFGYEL